MILCTFKRFPHNCRPLYSSARDGRTTWTRPPYLRYRPWVTIHCVCPCPCRPLFPPSGPEVHVCRSQCCMHMSVGRGVKGKWKVSAVSVLENKRVDMKYPDLSLSGTNPFFGVDLSHSYSSSFGNEWLWFGSEKSSAGVADWYVFFPPPCGGSRAH